MAKVVVVGSSNTDLVVRVDKLPEPGETVLGGEFMTAPGGKGANQAVAAARLGGEVVLIAKVGRDRFGDEAVDNFVREGIDTAYLYRDPELPSGVALILVGPEGRNMIAVAPGANSALSPEDVSRAEGAISSADVVLLQLEVPLETVEEAARIAKGHGVTVVLNPAPALELEDELLRTVDFLVPNEAEASAISGIRVTDAKSAQRAASELLERGAGGVVVTPGEEGAVLVTGEGSWHVEPPRVRAVDTTAAGDAFCGAFAFYLASRREPLEAVRFANVAAALSVTRMGAQPSIPTLKEVEEFILSSTCGSSP